MHQLRIGIGFLNVLPTLIIRSANRFVALTNSTYRFHEPSIGIYKEQILESIARNRAKSSAYHVRFTSTAVLDGGGSEQPGLDLHWHGVGIDAQTERLDVLALSIAKFLRVQLAHSYNSSKYKITYVHSSSNAVQTVLRSLRREVAEPILNFGWDVFPIDLPRYN